MPTAMPQTQMMTSDSTPSLKSSSTKRPTRDRRRSDGARAMRPVKRAELAELLDEAQARPAEILDRVTTPSLRARCPGSDLDAARLVQRARRRRRG